jgi:hypothetical protein
MAIMAPVENKVVVTAKKNMRNTYMFDTVELPEMHSVSPSLYSPPSHHHGRG